MFCWMMMMMISQNHASNFTWAASKYSTCSTTLPTYLMMIIPTPRCFKISRMHSTFLSMSERRGLLQDLHLSSRSRSFRKILGPEMKCSKLGLHLSGPSVVLRPKLQYLTLRIIMVLRLFGATQSTDVIRGMC